MNTEQRANDLGAALRSSGNYTVQGRLLECFFHVATSADTEESQVAFTTHFMQGVSETEGENLKQFFMEECTRPDSGLVERCQIFLNKINTRFDTGVISRLIPIVNDVKEVWVNFDREGISCHLNNDSVVILWGDSHAKQQDSSVTCGPANSVLTLQFPNDGELQAEVWEHISARAPPEGRVRGATVSSRFLFANMEDISSFSDTDSNTPDDNFDQVWGLSPSQSAVPCRQPSPASPRPTNTPPPPTMSPLSPPSSPVFVPENGKSCVRVVNCFLPVLFCCFSSSHPSKFKFCTFRL
jgi:hypothetical protein